MAHPRWKLLIFVLWSLVLSIQAQNITTNSTDNSTAYDSDPILQFRPSFARSLPVQILMTGIVFTLVTVLFIHLIFTAQYHWPLAQVNYVLQMSGVSTLLVSLIASMHVILNESIDESKEWPYMLSYIAVHIPPPPGDSDAEAWGLTERATWLLMNASTSGLIQITHIQFLTLLYPSRLEARLIFFLLAPLAIVSAVVQLLPIQGGTFITTASHAVRNVCNATLSLLFTLSLLIWGFLVNRKAAWRTDGGTSAFGAGAISLALISTGLNFLYIPSTEEYLWMPSLMLAVILWQSFLGWWWWVGAGIGVGQVDELLRKHEKRERKRKEKIERRKARKEKARMMWKGVTGAFVKEKRLEKHSSTDEDEEEVLSDGSNHRPEQDSTLDRASGHSRSPPPQRPPTIASTSSATTARILQTKIGAFLQRWYISLRQAHLTAARKQAVERVERINAVYGRESGGAVREAPGQEPGTPVVGWGLGSFGIREWARGQRVAKEHASSDESDEAEEVDGQIEMRNRRRRRRRGAGERKNAGTGAEAEPAPGSMWWWGPLRRWRLQDSTVYS